MTNGANELIIIKGFAASQTYGSLECIKISENTESVRLFS